MSESTVESNTVELKTNGGWCWYQDERVIVDRRTGRVLFATVASDGGAEGETRNGDIDITAYDPASGECETVTLSKILSKERGDDHNVAALWQRPDGRYLAVYTGHNHAIHLEPAPTEGGASGTTASDPAARVPVSFYRISKHPHDIREWGPERRFIWPSNDPVGLGKNSVTYSNLLHLSTEGGEHGRLYNFARAAGQVWQIATSEDWGETWTHRGMLSQPPEGGREYSNGYVKFAGNGADRIDFIITEAHPRDYNNGVYHGYIWDGKTHDATGKVIDPDTLSDEAPPPEKFTPLFIPQAVAPGKYHHGWTTEIKRGPDDQLFALFTTRHGVDSAPNQTTRPAPGDGDHRLFYARFDGQHWITEELAKMGGGLHDAEEDYTGLGTIDPRDGRTVYVSTPIDPRDGKMLAHHEVFRCRRETHDSQWTWTPVTTDSPADNLRPELAVLDDHRARLLWLHGDYPHQRHYHLNVIARPIGTST